GWTGVEYPSPNEADRHNRNDGRKKENGSYSGLCTKPRCMDRYGHEKRANDRQWNRHGCKERCVSQCRPECLAGKQLSIVGKANESHRLATIPVEKAETNAQRRRK